MIYFTVNICSFLCTQMFYIYAMVFLILLLY